MKKLILVLLLCTHIAVTFACSCIETNDSFNLKVKKSFIEANLVITGEVVAIKDYNTSHALSSGDPISYKIKISKIYKGKLTQKYIEITSARSGATCGYNFELGKSYLIYARKSSYFSKKTKNKFDFTTSLCDRNKQLKNSTKKELKILKRLHLRIR